MHIWKVEFEENRTEQEIKISTSRRDIKQAITKAEKFELKERDNFGFPGRNEIYKICYEGETI